MLQLMAMACAIASGVGMAMVNLVFGQFITLFIDYVTGSKSAIAFRSRAGTLGYVEWLELLRKNRSLELITEQTGILYHRCGTICLHLCIQHALHLGCLQSHP